VVDRFADVENPVGWDPRGAAITAFGDIGYPAKEAIPLLIDIIREGKDNGEIENAVTALGKIDIHDPGVIEALAEAYGHEYSGTRKAVSNAIANHAAELKGYIPIIADMLRSRNFDVSLYIIAALGDIGPEALPLLIEGLRMVKPDVRTYYISAIGKLGPAATKAIPDLIKSLDGDGKNEATSAASALGAIGPDAAEAVPALIAKLSSENQSLRDRVAVALGNIGPCARDAVPILIELARNEEINIADAIKALATIGPEPGVVQFLLEQLRHDNY
jgi:HEAT repeat protein